MKRTILASELSQAITSDKWDRVIQICNSSPSSAKTWTTRQGLFEGIKDANVLPIHEALVAGAPYEVIEALLFAYPDSVFSKESSYKRLPLHCACRKNAIIEVVELLMKHYGDAALTADNLGRLPSKYTTIVLSYIVLCCRELLYRMLDGTVLIPSKTHGFSFFNSFTVHYALSNGAVDQVIDTILNFQPSSARGFDKRGWTP
jgi:hypothetical protein